MKWLVIALFIFAAAMFALGKWTRISGRSPDEKAGSDIPYLLGAAAFVLAILLLAGWGFWYLVLS